MLEVLLVIANLCQMSSNAPISDVDMRQLDCQKYYIRCYNSVGGDALSILNRCVRRRK